MKTPVFKQTLLALGCGLLGASWAVADDTEIFFVNTNSSDVKPNILFILDNSGSMSADVTTVSTYDNTQTYSGSASTSNIYYKINGKFYSIPTSNNKCNDIIARLNASGEVTSYRMARWSDGGKKQSAGWYSLPTSNVSTVTECQNDRGIHGETASSTNKYARNHTNKWGTESQEIKWTDIELEDFYSANYVNWYNNHRTVTTKTRMEIVKEVSKSLADSMSNVNIGLMAFNTDGDQNEGGRMLVPVADIETNRADFKSKVDTLTALTWTPLSETLFEAMRYFQGGTPFLDSAPKITLSGGKYTSPITVECQASAIVLLTDGAPTEDTNHNSTMDDTVGTCTGNCLDEIAKYLHSTDQCPLDGSQTVSVYTVGFETDQQLLSDTATKGGGRYYLANDAATLATAFTSIVRSVIQTNVTFVSPGIAVNTFNRLNHLDSLYFSVFQPSLTPLWTGNLKRYRLASNGNIMDVDGNVAVDEDTGFFSSSAKSWWSSLTDGQDVSKGGAASRIASSNASRKVYTYLGANSSLSASGNAISVANKSNVSKTLFGNGSMSDAEHEELINWTRGADVFNETGQNDATASRKHLTDPLHSVPQLAIYGGTANSPDVTIFFGDNQGYLHAIDGTTGDSYFSFMPKELLANQKTLMDNTEQASTRPYGMDGSPTAWILDNNKDGSIQTANSDHVYIYSGMRRGGRSYYALNVTDRNNPSFLWSITGGIDGDDFEELGETWSKPTKTRVQIGNSTKEVLIFAGGYDPLQDSISPRTADTMGRAMYIVDATTGDLLWWAGPASSGADLELSAMQYSIPAPPKVIDVSGDGMADQIYVGDMGGQVWRFDINNGEQASKLVTAGVIAELADDTAEGNRRFYYSPDLFGLKYGTTRYLGLVIGSGWQEHPLDMTVEDRVYLLRITATNGAPTVEENGKEVVKYAKLTEADLFDTTENLIGQGTEEQKATASTSLAAAQGWYIKFTRDGEKMLSSSTTIGNQTFFTTYEPTPSDASKCVPSAGTPRLYHIYVQDGTPVINYDGIGADDELTRPDREVALNTPGLPPSPQRMRIDGKDIVCVGAECMPVNSLTGIIETFWYEE